MAEQRPPAANVRVELPQPLAPRIRADAAPSSGPLVASPETGPVEVSPTPLAAPFVDTAQDDVTSARSLDCLTAAVYYEARSEPVEGQRAVAQVVLNRVRHPGFPSSVCGVVYQGSERSTGCQFTFTCDGSMTLARDPRAWERSRLIAQQALSGMVDPDVGLATSYHAESVQPWWARSLDKVATVGSQIFYSLRGALGGALSFHQTYSGVEPHPSPVDLVQRPVALSMPARYTFADGASVAVHRGGDGASAAMASSFGVHVHVGSRSEASPRFADATVATVQVHRGGASSEPDPS